MMDNTANIKRLSLPVVTVIFAVVSFLAVLFLLITNPSTLPPMVKNQQQKTQDTPMVANAKQNLAQTNSVNLQSIKTLSVERKSWNDASLGCPKEGFMYVQVITPGYKIMLEAEGKQYEYHTDLERNVVLCTVRSK